MATVKISDLPQFTSPLAGTEVFPIVQSSTTKQAPLNSITNFLSTGTNGFLNSSVYKSASGNWESTYTTYNASSADYVSLSAANIFANRQVINGELQAFCFQGGSDSSNTGIYSSILGGYFNDITGIGSAIGAGYNNTNTGNYSFIGAGLGNCVTNDCAFVGSGQQNQATGAHSVVGGGQTNIACSNYSTVGGGRCNTTGSGFRYYNTVGGGQCNTAFGIYSTVGGGQCNTANGSNSTIAGGFSSCATGGCSFIGGGACNCVTHAYSSAIGVNVHSVSGSMLHANRLWLSAGALPTADPGVVGVVWNSSGTLKISV